MKDAISFNGTHFLDDDKVRMNVIRIPEVSQRIHEAQQIWEAIEPIGFDLYNFVAADEKVFLSNIKLKCLAAAVIQVGLYDRYLKRFPQPQIFIGIANGDSPLKVATGEISFEEMVCESSAVRCGKASAATIRLADEPLLSGIHLAEYKVYELTPNADEECVELLETQDLTSVFRKLVEEHGVKRFINVGPGDNISDKDYSELEPLDIQCVDSIDMDAMLSWFWWDSKAAV